MKKRIKSKFLKYVLYGCLPASAVILSLTGVAVIPKSVSYTVKNEISEQPAAEYKTVSDTTNIRKNVVYTLKLIDKKVCVLVDGNVMYEINVSTANLTDYDRQRLIDGITVSDENELIGLTEYLES